MVLPLSQKELKHFKNEDILKNLLNDLEERELA